MREPVSDLQLCKKMLFILLCFKVDAIPLSNSTNTTQYKYLKRTFKYVYSELGIDVTSSQVL